MTKKIEFTERFFKSIQQFENTIYENGNVIYEDELLDSFLDNGGQWLYDESYINSMNREFYRGVIRLFLTENKKVHIVSRGDFVAVSND